ncbi:hypothetical protein FKM82_021159 [Ascaphus truei]
MIKAYLWGTPALITLYFSLSPGGRSHRVMSGTVSMRAGVGLLGTGVLEATGDGRMSGRKLSSSRGRRVVSWRGLDGVVMSPSTAYMYTTFSGGGGELGDGRGSKVPFITSMSPPCSGVGETGALAPSK